MLAEKVRDLGLDRLGQQSTHPFAQDFGELIVDVSWLNQLDDVIFGHGISLLRWRSGGVKHPHDMPPSRFPPSPTFSDSSCQRTAERRAKALSRIAQLDQRTALPDQCLHSAERKSGFRSSPRLLRFLCQGF